MGANDCFETNSILYIMLTKQCKFHSVADLERSTVAHKLPLQTQIAQFGLLMVNFLFFWALARIPAHVGLKFEIESPFLTVETAVDKTKLPQGPFSSAYL